MILLELIIVVVTIFKLIEEYKTPRERMLETDNDPYCMQKTNTWYRNHPGVKPGQVREYYRTHELTEAEKKYVRDRWK